MSSPAFEAFLARLYTDAGFRSRFLADPAAQARAAGLAADEVAALVAIDREGLRLMADSLVAKRRGGPTPR